MNRRPPRRSDSPRAVGQDAERLAEGLLVRRGLTLLARNYRCRRGEIDLVMRDADALVFIEVRRRSNRGFGGGLESVDARKRARLVATAEHFLMTRRIGDDRPCRFDVVAIDGRPPHTEFEWVRDAFEA